MQINPAKKGATVGFYLVISAFILAMLSLGVGKLTIELILFSTLVCAVLTTAGDLTLRACRLTQMKAWLPMAFVVGFVVTAFPMMALALTVNLSALTAFLICAVAILGFNYFCFKGAARPAVDWADTAIALVFAIAIACLARIPVSSPTILLSTGMLPIWNDYFLHGITIASFGSPFVTGMDMELTGVSRVFYHYAPFMIPAAFQVVSGMSGLALSTSLLLPLGLLIAAFGAYAFAVELGGRLSGLLTLAAIISVPAFSVFIQSGWFDFYWLIFIAPGSGYALGVSAVVCATTLAYLKQKDNRVLWFTLLLLFSLILIRVHLFMLLAPAVVALLLIYRWRIHRRLLVGLGLGAITMALLALYFSSQLHTLWLTHVNPYGYLNNALEWSQMYGQTIKLGRHPFGLTTLMQILLILAAVLGLYFVLYPLLMLLSVRRFGFSARDALPILLMLSFIGLMLFAPSSRTGDFTEYKHRHFLLLYVLIAIYTISYAFSLVSSHLSNSIQFRRLAYAVVACIFVVSMVLNWGSNPARPNVQSMPWARNFHGQPITPGLLASAHYIKTHTGAGDVLAMDISSIGSTLNAPIVELISLTDVPAFISRADLKMTRSQCVRGMVAKRLAALQQLSAMDNWPDAQRLLHTQGIRWFVVPSGEPPKWDAGLKSAVFSTQGMSVYDAGHSASDLFSKPQC